jgi:MSHA pilin protein MshC
MKECASGFTMLELVIVIIMIGILSAYVAPRFLFYSDEQISVCQEASSLILHTQSININQGASPNVKFIALKTGQIGICMEGSCDSNDANNFVLHMDSQAPNVLLQTNKDSIWVRFNGMGQLIEPASPVELKFYNTKNADAYCVVSVNKEGAVSWK